MSDPLSITAGAVGLVSLGLTVCTDLLNYYWAWKDQHADVSMMCRSLESLSRTFKLLNEKVRHPLLDRKSVDRVTESIITCAAGVQGLGSKLDKIRNAKPAKGMSTGLQRALYPFQQKTLAKLQRTVTDLRSNLSVATETLQLDISITSLQQLNQINSDMKKLIYRSDVSSTKIIDGISKVHLNQKQEKNRVLSSEERDVINWLCPLDFFSKHIDALRKRQEGTGQWLLGSSEFLSWLDTAGKVIWCPGIPGAGKTILASTVISHLEQFHRRENTGVAYIYCVHNSPNQTASNFLGSLLQQLAMQCVVLLDGIKSCHKHHARSGTRPSLNETVRLLRSQVESFDKVFIVIDALDECPELDQTRKAFLTEVRGLLPRVSLMVTSRNIPSIENIFKHDRRLEIRAQDKDVSKFIESQMEHRDEFVDLLEGHDDVRSSITSLVLEKTNGMFLIAALHMDSLAKEDNIRELEESLQRLPGDLDRTYDDALERIKHQDSRKRARADQVFTLISCAKRPLSLVEVRQALSIRSGDTFLDPRALPKAKSFISACCGLVVIEGSGQTISFVHYTTEEYFRRKLQKYRSPEAHGHFAGVLITYLGFTSFATFSRDKMIQDLKNKGAIGRRASTSLMISKFRKGPAKSYTERLYMDTLLKGNTLLQYAAENWGHHARIAFKGTGYISDPCLTAVNCRNQEDSSWNLKQLIPDFLRKKPNVLYANEIIQHFEKTIHLRGDLICSPNDVTELHIAASFGIRYFVEYYLKQGVEIGARDSEGMTALHKAAKNGHVEIVRLLLDSGAAIGTLDRQGRSALSWSVSMKEFSVSRLLLQRGLVCRVKNVYGCGTSETSIAATAGHEEMLELLAEHETDDCRRNQLMGEALLGAMVAARDQGEGIVRFLMGGGKRWAISEQYQAKAMAQAASRGHVRIMKVLLEAGVDVSSSSPSGPRSLAEAPPQGNSRGTQHLLIARPNLSLKGDGGDLPLHAAVGYPNVHAVSLLLENGADVDARNSEGETAMVFLAKYIGYKFGRVWSGDYPVLIMQQLLERGADTAARDCELNRTSLEWAVSHGHTSLVWLLLERESFTALRKNAIKHLTKLYNAIILERQKAVKQFLHEKETLDLESISELLLVYIPAARGYQDVVLTFLQSGAAVEARTAYGESALHLAARKGHLEIIKILLHHEADINSKTTSGDTPLGCAAREGSIAAVELLLEHGAHVDSTSMDANTSTTAVTQALYEYDTEMVRVLLKRGADVNLKDIKAHGGTPLHIAARSQIWQLQARNIKLLLKHGANLEAKDDNGKTPLAAAAEDNKLVALQMLLERGANLERRDYNGETPLGAAVRKGLWRPVHVLLEKGADLEARNHKDHTPLVTAVRLGNIEMVQFLLEKGADPEAFSPSVTIENENVYDYDFERAVKIVLEAQSKTG